MQPTTPTSEEFILLPTLPSEQMLLNLWVVSAWSDTPGDTREDAANAYQRLLAKLPLASPGLHKAPVLPSEEMLLAISGQERFIWGEEYCDELDLAYDGFVSLVAELSGLSPEALVL